MTSTFNPPSTPAVTFVPVGPTPPKKGHRVRWAIAGGVVVVGIIGMVAHPSSQTAAAPAVTVAPAVSTPTIGAPATTQVQAATTTQAPATTQAPVTTQAPTTTESCWTGCSTPTVDDTAPDHWTDEQVWEHIGTNWNSDFTQTQRDALCYSFQYVDDVGTVAMLVDAGHWDYQSETDAAITGWIWLLQNRCI